MIYLPDGIIYNGVINGKDASPLFQKHQLRRKIMFFIFRLLIHMVAILIISYLLPGVFRVEGVWAALVAAFLLGIVNAVLRPILIFFTLPITVLTFGLFLLVINGLMLLLVSSIVRGFHVNGFWGAVLGSILISFVSWILSRVLPV
jgi:putative membrane protein